MSLERKQWALRAQQLQFQQLSNMRSQAEQWRNGLVALTALLAVVTIIKGPDAAANLPEHVRGEVVGLLGWAFGLLLTGSLLAMVAAFGVPGRKQFLTGEVLEQWEQNQAARGRAAMLAGAPIFVVGLLFVGSATRLVLLNSGGEQPILEVKLADRIVCGQLITSVDRVLTLGSGASGTTTTTRIGLDEVLALSVTKDCNTVGTAGR